MKNAVIKRINEGKKITEIGAELCEGLKYPKRKIIEIIIETKGKNYLIENKKQLGYRGGGGAGKPKTKKPEVQNFAVQEKNTEPNIKLKIYQLINECHDAHPDDWKEIILKCIEDFEEALLNSNDLTETSKRQNMKKIENINRKSLTELLNEKQKEVEEARAASDEVGWIKEPVTEEYQEEEEDDWTQKEEDEIHKQIIKAMCDCGDTPITAEEIAKSIVIRGMKLGSGDVELFLNEFYPEQFTDTESGWIISDRVAVMKRMRDIERRK